MSDVILEETETAELVSDDESLLPTEPTIERIALDDLDTTTLGNIRQDMDPLSLQELAIDIVLRGLIQYPVVVLLAVGDDATAYCVLAGNRRIAALKIGRDMVSKHNERCATENGFADCNEKNYPLFAYMDTELEFPYDDVPVIVQYSMEINETSVHELQLRENAIRADLNIMDKMSTACALLASGQTQAEVARMAGITQGAVSQYKTVHDKCIEEVHATLRKGDITLGTALAIAKFVVPNTSKPDVAAQREALARATEKSRKKDESAIRPRSLSDGRRLRVELTDAGNFAAADQVRRRIIQETLAWFDNPEISAADLLVPPEGGLNIEANMPELPPVKPPKAEKVEKEPKAAKGPKKTTKVEAVSTPATSASAPPAGARALKGPVKRK